MSFKKNNYSVLKNAISKELAEFVYKYFLNKRNVAKFLFDQRYLSPFTEYWGVWNDEQVPNTYSHYSDLAMETLLQEVKPIMEKHTGIKLSPTYSYARIYKNGVYNSIKASKTPKTPQFCHLLMFLTQFK